jgi:hypothetical protein
MLSKRAKFRKQIISGFLWLGALLLLVMAYWWGMTNYVIRDFWDPQYAMKSALLHAALEKNPGRPLWLILGSSHVDDGLRPGVLEEGPQKPGAPLIFNFAFGGGTIYREYICLRRLLDAGVKPQRVGIEVIGALISHQEEMFADHPDLIVRARPGELAELRSLAKSPGDTRAEWLGSRLNPFYKYGMQVPDQTLTQRLMPIPALRHAERRRYDDRGWLIMTPHTTAPQDYARGLASSKKEYEGNFVPPYRVAPHYDHLLRMTLDLCRKAGIDTFLFKMPEHPDFQAFYTPEADAVIDTYLAGIEREYGVKMIDARSWITDRQYFLDGHHLNGPGGKIFTLRFAEALGDIAPPAATQPPQFPPATGDGKAF